MHTMDNSYCRSLSLPYATQGNTPPGVNVTEIIADILPNLKQAHTTKTVDLGKVFEIFHRGVARRVRSPHCRETNL